MRPTFASIIVFAFSILARAEEHGAHAAAHEGAPKVVIYQAINVVLLLAILVWFGGPKIKAYFNQRYDDFMKQATAAAKIKKDLEEKKADLLRRTDVLRKTAEKSISESKKDAETMFIQEIEKARATAIKMDKDAGQLLSIDEQKLSERLRLEALAMSVQAAEEQLQAAGASEKGQFNQQFNQRVEGASV